MKKVIKRYLEANIYFKLIPFLFLYLTICLLFAKNVNFGDEGRYLGYAINLLHGYYSPPAPEFNLWSGPGYSLFLAPFILFNPPLLALKLLNGFLLYLSLVISYKTFNIFSSKKNAFLYTLLIGLYVPIYYMLPLIYTECLTWFLISLICFLLIKTFEQKNISWKLILVSSFSIAFLAMTKVIFGYVISIMIFISTFFILIPQMRSMAKKSILIFLFSFIFCLPWLFYTYNLTNKLFYWTNSGSMSLYTMSSPYENELGDWLNEDSLHLNSNHKIFMDSILKLNPLERDEAFKAAAIKNIRSHPKKYLSNWIANVGRLLFSYPYSFTKQKITTYFTIIPNMFLVVLLFLTFASYIKHYKKFPEVFFLLLIFFLIYLLGSSLVSAYNRMFYVTVPFWFVFLSFVFNNIITIKIKDY